MTGSFNTRHKVFISYYHEDDQKYKDNFEKLFKDIFINKSVQDGTGTLERYKKKSFYWYKEVISSNCENLINSGK